jgi:UDP-N-acetylglucosamine 3-dehydrogenase
MGRNHARILSSLPGAQLTGVFDQDADAAGEVAREWGGRTFAGTDELFGSVDAVVIALPTDLHFEFSRDALLAGLDVLVEKPITKDREQAAELCRIAHDAGRVLQVGHVERYNPVCMELPRLVKDPIFFSCERLSPYSPSWIGSSGVILDLMIHDLDIVLSLADSEVKKVNAVCRELHGGTEDLAVAQVEFASGTLADLTASRVSQAKVRRLSVTQVDAYVSADLVRQTLAVHHYVTSDYFYDARMGYKQETVTEIPYLSRYGEPLRLELESFVESVRERKRPIVSGEDGVRALDLALRVMKACGRGVPDA